MLGIAHHRGQHHTPVEQTVTPGAKHGFVDVGMYHSAGGAHPLGKGQRQVTCATSNVQHLMTGANIGHGDGVLLPDTVHAQGHQVVHDVVARCHRVKHATHPTRLLALVHGLKSEMSGTHAGNVTSVTGIACKVHKDGRRFSGDGRNRRPLPSAWGHRAADRPRSSGARNPPTTRLAGYPENAGNPTKRDPSRGHR